MALSKVNFNSMNVTPSASKAIKFNSSNNGLEAGDIGGSLVLISTVTASSSSTVDFTSGIDSTYKEYQFHFTDVHPATNDANLQVNFRDGGSSFDATKTTTFFRAYHTEDDGGSGLEYRTANDLAQSTGFQRIGHAMSTNNAASLNGMLQVFEPANTTFVKHFIGRASVNYAYDPGYAFDANVGGYFNTTSAIDAMQFKMSSGNIDAGVIKLYGIK